MIFYAPSISFFFSGSDGGRTQNIYVCDEHGDAPLLASKAHEGRFVVVPADNVCGNSRRHPDHEVK
jgi:hypothetical protein